MIYSMSRLCEAAAMWGDPLVGRLLLNLPTFLIAISRSAPTYSTVLVEPFILQEIHDKECHANITYSIYRQLR